MNVRFVHSTPISNNKTKQQNKQNNKMQNTQTTVQVPSGSYNSVFVKMSQWYKERLAAMEDKTISKAWKMPVNTDFTGEAWCQSFRRVK